MGHRFTLKVFQRCTTYKDTDLAWAAGIIDGEGSILQIRVKYSRFRITIGQASNNDVPEMLTRFKDIFRRGVVYKEQKLRSNKLMFKYQASYSDAEEIVVLIWPYLGTVKKEQAIKAGFIPPL